MITVSISQPASTIPGSILAPSKLTEFDAVVVLESSQIRWGHAVKVGLLTKTLVDVDAAEECHALQEWE